MAIPLVWIGMALVPFIMIVFVFISPLFLFVALVYGTNINQEQQQKRKKVLLIDNELETASKLTNLLARNWDIKHIRQSFRGIGKLLHSNYDLVLVRWTRQKLSGESILDQLDYAIHTRMARAQKDKPQLFKLPPLLFLRKTGAAEFKIHKTHEIPVFGCLDIEDINGLKSLLKYI